MALVKGLSRVRIPNIFCCSSTIASYEHHRELRPAPSLPPLSCHFPLSGSFHSIASHENVAPSFDFFPVGRAELGVFPPPPRSQIAQNSIKGGKIAAVWTGGGGAALCRAVQV